MLFLNNKLSYNQVGNWLVPKLMFMEWFSILYVLKHNYDTQKFYTTRLNRQLAFNKINVFAFCRCVRGADIQSWKQLPLRRKGGGVVHSLRFVWLGCHCWLILGYSLLLLTLTTYACRWQARGGCGRGAAPSSRRGLRELPPENFFLKNP